jgi:two-component system cell cycle response regulator DivK
MSDLLLILPSPFENQIKSTCMPGRIMIFDDDDDLLEVCSIILKSKNYEVYALNKCTDILKEVKLFLPNVILMDNWIPESGGVKATQQIKLDPELRPIPVIFFSADDRVQDLAAEAGAEFFLQKPFEIDDLENAVSGAIAIHLQSLMIETR